MMQKHIKNFIYCLGSEISRKFLISYRLLYQAQRIINKQPFELWMTEDSEERKFLLDVRSCKYTLEELYKIAVTRYRDPGEILTWVGIKK